MKMRLILIMAMIVMIMIMIAYFFVPSIVESKACRSIWTSGLRCTRHFCLQCRCTTVGCKYLGGTRALTMQAVCASQ